MENIYVTTIENRNLLQNLFTERNMQDPNVSFIKGFPFKVEQYYRKTQESKG